MKKLPLILSLVLIQLTSNLVSAQKQHQKVVTHKASPAPSDTYTVKFPKNGSSTKVDAYILGANHPVTFIVQLKRGKMMNASLNEMADKGPIHFKEMEVPTGVKVAFSGKSIIYPVTQTGTYKITVAAGGQKGEDWKGAFTLHVSLTKP